MSTTGKVLIVDDDQSLINLLKDYLPKVTKHELFVALTGEEALKIIDEKRPDVVLLDMQLPGIKGPQVLRIIREKYPDTKVLVVTSYDKQVKELMGKLGVDGFFPKPIILNEVVDRIETVLRSKEDTRVIPSALDDIKRKDGVIPSAKILFIEREFWMPYLLPISDADTPEVPPPLVEPYGEYKFEVVYRQRDAMKALAKFKPDIVICATSVPLKDKYGSESASTAGLIAEIVNSKYAPKGVIIHGSEQDINSHGIKKLMDDSSIWVGDIDPHGQDTKRDKENAERLNKMIWRICFQHDLVKKAKREDGR